MSDLDWKEQVVAPTLEMAKGYPDKYLEMLLARLEEFGLNGLELIHATHEDFGAWCQSEAGKLRAIQKARAEAQAMLDHADALEAEGRQGGADVVTLPRK
jgi:hypothetical protein